MSTETSPAPRRRRWLHLLIAFIVTFDVAAFFQWADGAYQSEFGAHADEAANYLAAVQARDQFARVPDRADYGVPASAASAGKFARAFPSVLGGWMLAFGTSRTAALLFMAVLAAANATLIFHAVRSISGAWAAAVASLVWLCAPSVRISFATILPEQLGALLLTAFVLLWVRMVGKGDGGRAALCGWAAVAAGIFAALLLCSVLAMALRVRPGDVLMARVFFAECGSAVGIAAPVFALVGVAVPSRSDARTSALRAALAALVAGVLFVRWNKAGVPDIRVLAVATPALAILAVRGALALAEHIGPQAGARFARRRALWLFLLVMLALPADLLHRKQKEWRGFGPVAGALIEEARSQEHVLVVSDPHGEGMFLSELAMRDSGARITFERGSATLTEPAGAEPRMDLRMRPADRFLEDEDLFAYLTAGRIRHIVFDSSVPQAVRADYHDQMRRVIEDNAAIFRRVFENPLVRDGEPMGHPLRIYRVVPALDPQLR